MLEIPKCPKHKCDLLIKNGSLLELNNPIPVTIGRCPICKSIYSSRRIIFCTSPRLYGKNIKYLKSLQEYRKHLISENKIKAKNDPKIKFTENNQDVINNGIVDSSKIECPVHHQPLKLGVSFIGTVYPLTPVVLGRCQDCSIIYTNREIQQRKSDGSLKYFPEINNFLYANYEKIPQPIKSAYKRKADIKKLINDAKKVGKRNYQKIISKKLNKIGSTIYLITSNSKECPDHPYIDMEEHCLYENNGERVSVFSCKRCKKAYLPLPNKAAVIPELKKRIDLQYFEKLPQTKIDGSKYEKILIEKINTIEEENPQDKKGIKKPVYFFADKIDLDTFPESVLQRDGEIALVLAELNGVSCKISIGTKRSMLRPNNALAATILHRIATERTDEPILINELDRLLIIKYYSWKEIEPYTKALTCFLDKNKPYEINIVSPGMIERNNAFFPVSAYIFCKKHKKPILFNVFYCVETGDYYISYYSYIAYAQTYGLPYLRIKSNEGRFYSWDMRVMSDLRLYGYRVNKNDALTSSERHEILQQIIDLELLSKYKIVDHLEWLINTHPAEKYINARNCWKEDLLFVNNYRSMNQKKIIGEIKNIDSFENE